MKLLYLTVLSFYLDNFNCDAYHFSDKFTYISLAWIYTNQTNQNVLLDIDSAERVKTISFHASNIEVWTSIYCDTFPNLENIIAADVGVVLIQPDAFKKCKKLKFLSLISNKIAHIFPETFSGLHELENLFLSNNKLTGFEEAVSSELKQLKRLSVSGNEIFNINVPALTMNLPNLQWFWFNDNNLRCETIRETLTALPGRCSAWVPFYKQRNENLIIFNDYNCLEPEEWQKLLTKQVAEI